MLHDAGTRYTFHVAGYRLQVVGCRLHIADYRLHVAGYMLHVVCCRLHAAGYRLHACYMIVTYRRFWHYSMTHYTDSTLMDPMSDVGCNNLLYSSLFRYQDYGDSRSIQYK